MSERRIAVVVGVDTISDRRCRSLRFAQADAQAIYDVLVAPELGGFDPDDVVLLLEGDAQTEPVRLALRGAAKSAAPSDFLLVYFAGHGIIPPWDGASELYLGTADADFATLEDTPQRALRMDFLRKDVFEYTKASSLLLLDCCQAGGYITGTTDPTRAARKVVLSV